MFSLPAAAILVLPVSLLFGTLCFSFIGAIGAALTVSLQKGGLLLSLVIMPLYIPVLVFGAGAVSRSVEGFGVAGPLAVLAALSAFSLAFAPLLVSAALKVSLES
jgi:heme exporter protein B